MNSGAVRQPLPGGRWHLQHGPIDIVIGADGDPAAVHAAHEAAWERFGGVLAELVAELPLLRRPIAGPCPLRGRLAQRMWWACRPYHSEYITPMAAVAGSVAQELIAFYRRDGIRRAWVNNGGDIALHLAEDAALRIGLYADIAAFDAAEAARAAAGTLPLDGAFAVTAAMPVRGVATSGWRGRSFSLGIADSVTVLARSASEADAAATMVANAVNVDDPRIVRRPASELKDDTDLGDIPVTVDVPALPAAQVEAALAAGCRRAHTLRASGLLHDALITCQGRAVHLGGAAQAVEPGKDRVPALVQ